MHLKIYGIKTELSLSVLTPAKSLLLYGTNFLGKSFVGCYYENYLTVCMYENGFGKKRLKSCTKPANERTKRSAMRFVSFTKRLLGKRLKLRTLFGINVCQCVFDIIIPGESHMHMQKF